MQLKRQQEALLLTWASLLTPGPWRARQGRLEMGALARTGSVSAARRAPARGCHAEPQGHPFLVSMWAKVCLPHTQQAPSRGCQPSVGDGVKGRFLKPWASCLD